MSILESDVLNTSTLFELSLLLAEVFADVLAVLMTNFLHFPTSEMFQECN